MKNLQNFQEQAEQMKKKLSQIKCTGNAMGNMVEVVVTGDMRVESVKIDPSIVREGQEAMLEVLVAGAVNSALDSVREKITAEAKEAGGLAGLTL